MPNSNHSSGVDRWAALATALGLAIPACGPSDRESEELVKPGAAAVESATAAQESVRGGGAQLTWTGCDISRKAYVSAAVAAYEKETGVRVTVNGGGATRGIRATVGGTSDVGGACRHTLPGRFPEEEGGAVLTVVGWDALVFFTHVDNPVEGITSEQAKQILMGDIKSWRDLGGPDEAIIPVFRQQTVSGKLSGVGYMTRLLLFEKPDVEYTSEAIFFVSSGPVEEYVEITPFSIAVTGVSSARKRKVRILALDGVVPTREHIANGDYLLFRPLYLVTRGEPTGQAKDFLDWTLSERGQATLSDQGTVNRKEGEKLFAMFDWPDESILRNH